MFGWKNLPGRGNSMQELDSKEAPSPDPHPGEEEMSEGRWKEMGLEKGLGRGLGVALSVLESWWRAVCRGATDLTCLV